MQALTFTTRAYQQEALRLVIGQANQVARELHLQESLPITESNLVAAFILPPGGSKFTGGGLGNITTSNYLYNNSDGDKFSGVDYMGPKEPVPDLEIQNLAVSEMGTNEAYQSATQILDSISADVTVLNRDCRVQIAFGTTEIPGFAGKVPFYGAYWMPRDPSVSGCMADVEFAGAGRFVRRLDVSNPKYLLMPPLLITNLDYLLSQTNQIERPGDRCDAIPLGLVQISGR